MFRKAPSITLFKNFLKLKLRLIKKKEKRAKQREAREQVAKEEKVEGSLIIPRRLRSNLQYSLKPERRCPLMIKL